MTGMRSCTIRVTELAVVVRIEQLSIAVPFRSLQQSHIPANANNSPPFTSKQYGCLTLPLLFHSRSSGSRMGDETAGKAHPATARLDCPGRQPSNAADLHEPAAPSLANQP